MQLNKIHEGNCLKILRQMQSNSVDCCVTSPPYFGLRDYGTANWEGGTTRMDEQIGLEQTPEQFVRSLVEVFNEVKRVLKPTGTLWLNLGDSYCSTGTGSGNQDSSGLQGEKRTQIEAGKRPSKINLPGLKPKDLIGIPWMVAFALREAGWYLRQDIIWSKRNPMPESVTDRCTKSHEYIFLLSKSAKYYYDAEAIKQDALNPTDDIRRMMQQKPANKSNPDEKVNGLRPREHKNLRGQTNHSFHKNRAAGEELQNINAKANKRSVWKGEDNYSVLKWMFNNLPKDIFQPLFEKYITESSNKNSVWNVSTKPFSAAHFATFPENLILDCIKAGSSEHGCCSECGKPYERIVENKFVLHEKWYGDKTKESKNSRGAAGNSYNEKVGSITTGWQPTCKCEAAVTPSVILDPFSGAGTTALVARKLNRNFMGIELNPEYIKLSNDRLKKELGMFL